ncbi:hypothetical protein PNBC_19405 [Paenibacillus crassostreae]|uniref:Uncharacterized protein n=1 Tax=Paenibacillus crassostreae TaxID=1763538 RepID=A0A167AV55_9BACL|nr:hypothetical protein LPB68_16535 [Paenibacillus crassostreae]OAB71468.1 hypothetical protein PNBC_19405 [Paenibacillus crassostreae]
MCESHCVNEIEPPPAASIKMEKCVFSKTYLMQITAKDLDEGQLHATSAVRVDKIYTFSN